MDIDSKWHNCWVTVQEITVGLSVRVNSATSSRSSGAKEANGEF